MTEMRKLIILCLLVFATACVTTPNSGNLPARMSKEKIRSLADSVFEIVIPKQKNKRITYHEKIPTERIPIQIRNSKYVSVGTAFAIGKNRFISAAHVFEIEKFAEDPRVFIRDRGGKTYKIGKIFKYSTYRDLVVFSLTSVPKKVTPLVMRNTSEVGDTVYTVGNAYGEGISFRDGQIANYTPEPHQGQWKYVRYTAAASPGNSGGPLLNTRGEVLGVVTMKNESENLNFAVPASEIKKLSRKTAEFYTPINSVTTPTGRQNVVVKFSAKLPATFERLSNKSKALRTRFWKTKWKKIYSATEKKRFPMDPQAADWLRRQEYASVLSFIGRNEAGAYEMETRDGSVVPRANGDRMRITFDGDDLTMFNYIPAQNGRHATYLRTPQLILDGIVEAQGWVRELDDERIPINSLGKPTETSRFVDPLGRPWIAAKWRTPFDYMTHVMNCTAVPKGFSCFLYHLPTHEENTAFQYRFQNLDATELALSYSGTVGQWRGFLELPKQWLPTMLHGASVVNQGNRIVANIGPFRTSVTDNLAGDRSFIFAGVGFRRDKPRQIEIHGLRFTHGTGPKNEFLQIHDCRLRDEFVSKSHSKKTTLLA